MRENMIQEKHNGHLDLNKHWSWWKDSTIGLGCKEISGSMLNNA